MKIAICAGLLLLGIGCVTQQNGPIKTEVVTFPDGALIEFNGQRLGRAPADVVLPQDDKGNLKNRAEVRALPNSNQEALFAQTRTFQPGDRNERVPNRILIDMTLHQTNSAGQVTSPSSTDRAPAYIQTGGKSSRPKPRRLDRSKPTQPVGIDRWNPGKY